MSTPNFHRTLMMVLMRQCSVSHPEAIIHNPRPNYSADHQWKLSFLAKCLNPILNAAVSNVKPDYSSIVDLDRMVRDFSTQSAFDIFEGDGSEIPRSLAVQRAIVRTSREIGVEPLQPLI
jgi:hypothetical protein